MSDSIQPIIDQAASAARAGDNTGAARLWRRAAETSYRGGDKRRSLTLALCCVASHMRVPDLDAADEAMRAVDELEAELPGMDGNIAESIRTRRIQLKTERELAKTKAPPAPAESRSPEEIQEDALNLDHLVHKGLVPESKPFEPGSAEPRPAEPLSAQEILDRAIGVGVTATISESGNVFFADKYTANEGEDPLAAGDEAVTFIRETLESVGLTTENAAYANGEIAGRIIEAPKK